MQNWNLNTSSNSSMCSGNQFDTKEELGGYFSNSEEKRNPFDLQLEEDEQEDVFARTLVSESSCLHSPPPPPLILCHLSHHLLSYIVIWVYHFLVFCPSLFYVCWTWWKGQCSWPWHLLLDQRRQMLLRFCWNLLVSTSRKNMSRKSIPVGLDEEVEDWSAFWFEGTLVLITTIVRGWGASCGWVGCVLWVSGRVGCILREERERLGVCLVGERVGCVC